jgi:uncharacterized protein YmfQ (DUF2313 family)
VADLFYDPFNTLDGWLTYPSEVTPGVPAWQIVADPDTGAGTVARASEVTYPGTALALRTFDGQSAGTFYVGGRLRRIGPAYLALGEMSLGALVAGFSAEGEDLFTEEGGTPAGPGAFPAAAWREFEVAIDMDARTYSVSARTPGGEWTEYGADIPLWEDVAAIDAVLIGGMESASRLWLDDVYVSPDSRVVPASPPRASKYSGLLERLLPAGPVWTRTPSSHLMKLVAGLAPSLARPEAAMADLKREADPARAIDLLAEWEEALSIPDACAQSDLGLADRQARLVASLVPRGGQTPAYFVALAAAAGVGITIREYREEMHRVGESARPFAVGPDLVYGEDALFLWEVTFDRPRDALAREIECRIRKRGPEQSDVFFTYPS